jgi:chromatin remodeling complex protein RSC6
MQAPVPTENNVNTNVNNKPNENETDQTADTNIDSMLKNIDAQVSETKKSLAQVQIGLRVVRRQAYVLSKLAAKAQKPKRRKAEGDGTKTRASGFAAASILSPELKVFMSLQPTDMRSRTEVTKWLCNYIQECNLQGTEDKRYIMFKDEKGLALQKLLKCEKSQITYFDLQYYLKFHISSKNNPMSGTETTTEVVETSETSETVTVTPATTTNATVTSAAPAAPARKAAIRPRPVTAS